MKTKFIIFLSVILIQLSCFAQTKVYTSIEENKTKYPEKNFAFEKVIDARKTNQI